MASIVVFRDAALAAAAAAQEVARLAAASLRDEGRFSMVLSGGSTPRGLYRLLADEPLRSLVDWSRVDVFWGDERCVPPDHPESNFRLARQALLSRVPIPGDRIHRVRGEDEPSRAAKAYDAELRRHAGDPPLFSLLLLGLGADGHTASLFPGSPALEDDGRLVAAVRAPSEPSRRITLTPLALRCSAEVLVLTVGRNKAGALARTLGADPDADPTPAAAVVPAGSRVLWMVDREAASRLSPSAVAPDGDPLEESP